MSSKQWNKSSQVDIIFPVINLHELCELCTVANIINSTRFFLSGKLLTLDNMLWKPFAGDCMYTHNAINLSGS